VVLALGTRLNPFSTLPGYGIDYWPKDAKIIQVDINPDRIGLTKKVTVGIVGDAAKVADGHSGRWPTRAAMTRAARRASEPIAQTKSAWAQQLSSMDHEDDDPGTTWNERARAAKPDWMSPRMAWRAIQSALPREAIISSDIGNNCAIGNAYPDFEEGRKYLAPGLFGPCGYGLPSIVGAKIACPDVPVVGFRRRRRLRHRGDELTAIGAARMAGDHHGRVPQLPVGRGKAELDPLVRRQFRRHRAGRRGQLCRHRQGLRAEGRRRAHDGRTDRRAEQGDRRTRWPARPR
jgi:sulfoacetaldehyde acetyltransferase